ncbi:MAG: beta-lactamase family protein [Gemmatimonadetes bacterium]|nr:beta-lactamase family protein [Gemmatimonadota bacterium]
MIDSTAIDRALNRAIDQNFIPGAILAFGQQRTPLYCRVFGNATLHPSPQPMRVETIFDLASLTKVLGTTLVAMKLFEEGEIDLDRPLGDYLKSHYPADKAALTPRHLLVHAAGFPPSITFYKGLLPEPDAPGARRQSILEQVRQVGLIYPPGSESQYSDLGMILFGDLLEQLSGMSLDHLYQERVAAPLELPDTFFIHLDRPLPHAQRPLESFAATEECAWRDRIVRGQVHDENAYLLRGVAGHAGLFSSVSDLQKLSCALLAAMAGESDFLTSSTLELFTRRQGLVPGSDRALGWGTPIPGASCGCHFSPRAIGHTGFTGTSIWIDPERERFVLLLTNRVHPSRQDTGFLSFRPQLHDLVVEALNHP